MILKDSLFKITELEIEELVSQAKMKQSTLEGSYLIKHNTVENFQFTNDKRKLFLVNLKNIERELYNLEGEKINTFIISSKDHSIFDTKILDINDISYSISLFGNKNSNEAIGIQIDKFKLMKIKW